MRVRPGEVYGFLGPERRRQDDDPAHAARADPADVGQRAVLGRPPGSPEGLSRTGALIETPSFYPFLSGRDNLRVLARHAGVAESRIPPSWTRWGSAPAGATASAPTPWA